MAIRPYESCRRGIYTKIRIENREGEHTGSPLYLVKEKYIKNNNKPQRRREKINKNILH